jgi:hypothetical protein
VRWLRHDSFVGFSSSVLMALELYSRVSMLDFLTYPFSSGIQRGGVPGKSVSDRSILCIPFRFLGDKYDPTFV